MAGDTGATDIEITPAMVEAGTREFWGHDNQYESAEVLVQRIYRAMVRAKIESPPSKDRTPLD